MFIMDRSTLVFKKPFVMEILLKAFSITLQSSVFVFIFIGMSSIFLYVSGKDTCSKNFQLRMKFWFQNEEIHLFGKLKLLWKNNTCFTTQKITSLRK